MSQYLLPLELRNLQLERTKYPLFSLCFGKISKFPVFSMTGIFFGYFPCFPCAVGTLPGPFPWTSQTKITSLIGTCRSLYMHLGGMEGRVVKSLNYLHTTKKGRGKGGPDSM